MHCLMRVVSEVHVCVFVRVWTPPSPSLKHTRRTEWNIVSHRFVFFFGLALATCHLGQLTTLVSGSWQYILRV